ncbi:MAG: peptidylprolyl isomerase [Desulfocapsaceae bacterium]|jgi:peptidylprolyl isomerase|nr:peptidylprolyl isomerase [Desulfocapsaceae bacterium]
MAVKQGDTVQVHYTGSLTDGEVFDSSQGHDPLSFTVGSGQVIPGFSDAVVGMEVGDKKDVQIPVERAYGERDEEMVIVAPVEQIPPGLDPEIGQLLEVGGTGGEILRVRVVDLDDKNITLDANPPLAGQDLNFSIELVGVA